MNKMFAAAALAAACVALPVQAQFAKAEDAVAYRQGAYRVLAHHFGSLGAMANDKMPFDAARAAALRQEHIERLLAEISAKLSAPEPPAAEEEQKKAEPPRSDE